MVFELEKVGTQSFRFHNGRFQRLSKLPKSSDIIIATSVETLTRVMWGAIKFEDVIRTGKILVKRGSEVDIQMLRKVLIRMWDD